MKHNTHCAARIFSPLLLVLALAAAFLAGGCDDAKEQAGKSGGKPVIGVLLYDKRDTYISLVYDSLQKEIDGKAEVLVFDAANDQLTQDEQLEKLIESKGAAAIINLVDTQAASKIVDKAKKAGMPVVFFNREPDLNSIKTYDKARFVGTTANDAGIMQGDIIKELWDKHPEYDRNQDGQVQYVMFQAGPDNPEAVARTEYSIKSAIRHGLTMRQVGETYMCNWNEDLARDGMLLAITSHGGEIELVIANNDAMALGAVAALQEAGYNLEGGDKDKFIPVVGVDATPQAVEAIQKGVMSATVRQDAAGMGKVVVAMTLNAVAGKEFLDGVGLKYDESGIAVRIPYSPYSGN